MNERVLFLSGFSFFTKSLQGAVFLVPVFSIFFTFPAFAFNSGSALAPAVAAQRDSRYISSKCVFTTQDQARNAQVQMTKIGDGCGVYVTPVQRESMQYRSYLFTDEGLLQIFNSFGNGTERVKTGARVYAIFPRTRKVSFNISVGQNFVRVQTANDRATFKIRTTPEVGIESIDGSDFLEEKQVASANNGGLELLHNQFFYMDAGFGVGNAPQSNSAAFSTFHDVLGHQCVVPNRKIFHYVKGEAHLKSDSHIRRLVAGDCPELKVF